MSQEVALFKGGNLPLVNNALESVEKMKEFCQLILDSKLAPDHFYPKIPGSSDRDYTKGNIASVMMVGIHGSQLGLPFMVALQQVVPVNGLMSLKGDGCKSLILNSGLVKPNSWRETEEGSIENGTYVVTITAQRTDTGETMSRSFSVAQAKKAGLWITDEMIKAQDGYKWKKSAWYKYPDRMCKYRALGFLARDLFPDVMAGTYTEEEARDIPQDPITVIENQEGTKIIIPDKQFARERSEALTSRAVDKIDKHLQRSTEHIEVSNIQPEPEVHNEGTVEFTEDDLKNKKVEELMAIIEAVPDLLTYTENLPGKNTNKKLRDVILGYQEGTLAAISADSGLIDGSGGDDMPPMESLSNVEAFEQAGPEIKAEINYKVEIEIPDLPTEGVREFSVAAKLYGALNTTIPAVTDKRFLEVASTSSKLIIFKDKEDFCRKATREEVKFFLEKNGVV